MSTYVVTLVDIDSGEGCQQVYQLHLSFEVSMFHFILRVVNRHAEAGGDHASTCGEV
jgi:hypothetical protein